MEWNLFLYVSPAHLHLYQYCAPPSTSHSGWSMHHAPLHAKSPPPRKKNNNGGFGAACEEFGTVTRGSSPISLIFTSVTKHGNWWSSNQFRDKHHHVASLQSTPLNHQSSGETREKQHIRLLLSTFSGPGAGTPVVFVRWAIIFYYQKWWKPSFFVPWKNRKLWEFIPPPPIFLPWFFKIHFLEKVA